MRDTDKYKRLYSLNVLVVENSGEDVHKEFQESILKRSDGRYEGGMPWISGTKLSNTNEEHSRRCLRNVKRQLNRKEKLKIKYNNTGHQQIKQGFI